MWYLNTHLSCISDSSPCLFNSHLRKKPWSPKTEKTCPDIHHIKLYYWQKCSTYWPRLITSFMRDCSTETQCVWSRWVIFLASGVTAYLLLPEVQSQNNVFWRTRWLTPEIYRSQGSLGSSCITTHCYGGRELAWPRQEYREK